MAPEKGRMSHIFRPFRPLSLMVVLGPLAASSGCATILGGGGKEPVLIETTPNGAHVEVVDQRGKVVHNGVTPMTLTLRRGAGYFRPAMYTVRAATAPAGTPTGAYRMAGAAPREARLTGKLNGWYWGNILFGGLIGMLAVDPASGAMWNLPNEFNVDAPASHKRARQDARRDSTH